jgi:hypothetical protein
MGIAVHGRASAGGIASVALAARSFAVWLRENASRSSHLAMLLERHEFTSRFDDDEPMESLL